jgi:cell fate regulator YaaT (PSP1 superfamily)
MTESPTEQKKEGPKPADLAVGVQFRPAGKIYTFVTTDPSLKKGEEVVVESEGGPAIATVISPPVLPTEEDLPQKATRLLRRASPDEMEKERTRRERALECFTVCRDRIRERKLPMKLVEANVSADESKVIFSFFAEHRVDFRSLVKELAQALRMRIEMRQIGARDEAKTLPCLGPCGLPTCCSYHLRQFQSISISMAKHQGLTPNPPKITGMCGKLKCCLAYEHAAYEEQRQGLPKLGSAVESPKGVGKVVGHNVLKRECIVRLYGGVGETRCPCDQCRPLSATERDAAIAETRREKEGEEPGARPKRRGRKGERKDRGHGKRR